MASKALPTPEQLRQLLDYDPETGALTWRARGPEMFKPAIRPAKTRAAKWSAKNAGKLALTADNGDGYLIGRVYGSNHRAHRVIWAMHYGAWPAGDVDHINGNRKDNRIVNLRAATKGENARNAAKRRDNTSGACGVSWHRHSGKWMARIKMDGKSIFLGRFTNLEDAVKARKMAEARIGGFTERHGT
jgi:hypothetical protein